MEELSIAAFDSLSLSLSIALSKSSVSHRLKASQRPSPPETVRQPVSTVASRVMPLHQAAGTLELQQQYKVDEKVQNSKSCVH